MFLDFRWQNRILGSSIFYTLDLFQYKEIGRSYNYGGQCELYHSGLFVENFQESWIKQTLIMLKKQNSNFEENAIKDEALYSSRLTPQKKIFWMNK